MSDGFSFDWLALREPADHAARDPELVSALAGLLAVRPRPLRIVDLGCGTGSNLRALAPHLGEHQLWRLVDHDPALLDRAQLALGQWADRAEPLQDGMRLRKGPQIIDVTFSRHDFATGWDAAIGAEADLVTASALLDLVSRDGIASLVAAVAARGTIFYTALTYDGREIWEPAHPADAAIHAAFLADMARDKGLGPAAGDRAPGLAKTCFEAEGYRVQDRQSDWRLDGGYESLRQALATGKVEAAIRSRLVSDEEAETWAETRAQATSAMIGHVDLLAMPPPGLARDAPLD